MGARQETGAARDGPDVAQPPAVDASALTSNHGAGGIKKCVRIFYMQFMQWGWDGGGEGNLQRAGVLQLSKIATQLKQTHANSAPLQCGAAVRTLVFQVSSY
jgi:hypothetical protein